MADNRNAASTPGAIRSERRIPAPPNVPALVLPQTRIDKTTVQDTGAMSESGISSSVGRARPSNLFDFDAHTDMESHAYSDMDSLAPLSAAESKHSAYSSTSKSGKRRRRCLQNKATPAKAARASPVASEGETSAFGFEVIDEVVAARPLLT